MLALALNECKNLGLSKVLITCKKGNIGSEKAIIKNGGIKENEAKDQNRIYNRYLLTLS